MAKKIVTQHTQKLLPLGYLALTKHFHIQTIIHYRASFFDPSAKRKRVIKANDDRAQELHIYSKTLQAYDFKDPLEHLLFAIKYEGINLGILKKVFQCISKQEIERFITSNKFRKEARKVWYLYEELMQSLCILPDGAYRTYYELLDPKTCYTCHPRKSTRHGILDNLLGDFNFCPMVRRTKTLSSFEKKKLDIRASRLLKKQRTPFCIQPPPTMDVLGESTSAPLEKERASKKRLMRFASLLKEAKPLKTLTLKRLISIHNKAVGKGHFENSFRHHQNYLAFDDVVESGKICRISPKPKDVEELMQGLIDSFERMKKSSLNPVVLTAIFSFGFSIIHPFGDGNGRVQLFLLYYLLKHSHFKQAGQIFGRGLLNFFYLPGFNEAVQNFDEALLACLEYTLHKKGTLTVHGETIDLYRYIDFTPMVEFLFSSIEESQKNYRINCNSIIA